MEWTAENRLKIINQMAKNLMEERSIFRAQEKARDITFVCQMPDDWLERNQINFAKEIAAIWKGEQTC